MSEKLKKSREMSPWCSCYHHCTTSFNKASTQVLRRFKSCSRRVGDSRCWGSLGMVPAGNKAKRLSSVNHTIKTIHHHQQHFSSLLKGFQLPKVVLDLIAHLKIQSRCVWSWTLLILHGSYRVSVLCLFDNKVIKLWAFIPEVWLFGVESSDHEIHVILLKTLWRLIFNWQNLYQQSLTHFWLTKIDPTINNSNT